jgi:hypothetical protein
MKESIWSNIRYYLGLTMKQRSLFNNEIFSKKNIFP